MDDLIAEIFGPQKIEEPIFTLDTLGQNPDATVDRCGNRFNNGTIEPKIFGPYTNTLKYTPLGFELINWLHYNRDDKYIQQIKNTKPVAYTHQKKWFDLADTLQTWMKKHKFDKSLQGPGGLGKKSKRTKKSRRKTRKYRRR